MTAFQAARSFPPPQSVVASQPDVVSVEFALDSAGLDGDRHRADEILARVANEVPRPIIPSMSGDWLPWARWETDGGRVLGS